MLTTQLRIRGEILPLVWLILIASVMLQGCVSTDPMPVVKPLTEHERARDNARQLATAEQRATALSAAALLAPVPQRLRIELEAAEQWLQARKLEPALTLANRLDFSTDKDEWLLRRQLLIARIKLAQGDTAAAKKALKFVHQLQLSPHQLAPATELLAIMGGSTQPSTDQLSRLVGQLSTTSVAAQRHALQTQILDELQRFPVLALEQTEPESFSAEVLPWVKLALINRGNRTSPQRLAEIDQWQVQHPHIRVDVNLLAEIEQPKLVASSLPTSVALLLPYTGNLSHAGETLHKGIMAAYFNTALAASSVKLHSYDTGAGDDVATLYQRAVTAGAQLIIGPLQKEHIKTLVDQQLVTIPTLALNHMEASQAPPMLLQLGLSPEDEIDQLTRLAWALGHRRAAIFHSEDPLGIRLNQAFENSWAALGGSVAAHQAYPADARDFSSEITTLLGLNLSQLRHQKLQQHLHLDLQFTPRRRQDIDFLFLAALPAQARAIRPQFRFHQADDLPVFATSHLYSGQPNQELDKDLNQVSLCDTPYTFSEHTDKQSLPRIYALGRDAFALLPFLTSLRASSLRQFDGSTGALKIDQYGQFRAQLTCGRFRRGVPEKIASWH